jgi:hypothetical protein
MRRTEVDRGASRRTRRLLALAPVVLALAGCSSWRTVGEYDGWTLHGESGKEVEVARFQAAIGPAKSAVEEILGPFEKSVSIYAWSGEAGP